MCLSRCCPSSPARKTKRLKFCTCTGAWSMAFRGEGEKLPRGNPWVSSEPGCYPVDAVEAVVEVVAAAHAPQVWPSSCTALTMNGLLRQQNESSLAHWSMAGKRGVGLTIAVARSSHRFRRYDLYRTDSLLSVKAKSAFALSFRLLFVVFSVTSLPGTARGTTSPELSALNSTTSAPSGTS